MMSLAEPNKANDWRESFGWSVDLVRSEILLTGGLFSPTGLLHTGETESSCFSRALVLRFVRKGKKFIKSL